ncbi:pimeloyl-ACP methyl ester carboxylesterase [Pseudoclavibacter chungangensis]|uniref:alpha/beta fold hydrolase n=1 Tax=Pseudoclavibacter chungangensis TaxID=587635 RepID=UPI0015C8321C|nr:alpha/beta hydrolase [Pseudoclavibacter chungangensis]NYJ65424.1 pimeloyl-ACP methyl ester carboxylesterase [Pseudoclavibacter chungangensis]
MPDADVRDPSASPARGTILIAHGSMDTGRSFRRLRDALPNWRTVAYDRRGYGRSFDPAEAPASIGEHVADLRSLLDGPTVLLGHSMGGVLALMATALDPELVRAVVVYEAPLPWLEEWPDAPLARSDDPALVRAAGERFVRHAMGEGAWERLSASQRERFHDWSAALERELGELTFRPDDPALRWPFDPADVTVPVLVLHGSETAGRHRLGAPRWLEVLPDATGTVIEGAAHTGHVTHPAAIAQAIESFASERLGNPG